MNFEEIYSKLGYSFNHPILLENALTHPSMISEQVTKKMDIHSYERLEFLGDSVLGFVISDILIKSYPNEQEGDLSKRKTVLVCGQTLFEIAEELCIGEFIVMSKGEEINGGRNSLKNLENVMEAIIGAIYLDGGLLNVTSFITKNWSSRIKSQKEPPQELKSQLQELSQKYYNSIPKYKVLGKSGLEHMPTFHVSVSVENLESCTGDGKNKKEAEKDAAKKMIDIIQSKHSLSN